ncbi:MAG TPA: PilZ domain-containing protein [Blastocatellia bacterium]|nr:PilZ domain-containing protein [Blastocatellia bacterium]
MNDTSISPPAEGGNHAPSLSGEAKTSVEQLSSYYLDLERLLDRTERATTHYHLFGIDRSATYDQVQLAYREVVSTLFPAYGISAAVPVEMIARIDRAFDNATRAFKTLANFNRRLEYDDLSQTKPAMMEHPPSPPSPDQEAIEIKRVPHQKEVFTQYSKSSLSQNRRRTERFRLGIPVRATGHDRKGGKWNEIGQTLDVSRTGINLRMRRRVRSGAVLYLTLPLPVKLRSHGYSDSTYNVYAIVRRVDPPMRGERFVGLEFIGEHPPAGYLENPWALFKTARWSGHERRWAPRIAKREVVWVEYYDEARKLLGREEARTENVSRRGARISVRTAPSELDLIKITSPVNKFESFATVRSRFRGIDGAERLCIQFVDKEWQ